MLKLVPSKLTMLKEYIRLEHAGIVNHFVYWYQIKEKYKKGTGRNNKLKKVV